MSIVQLARSIYWHRRFSKSYGSYRGIYETEAQAIAAVPPHRKVGYNHPELAAEYRANLYREIGFYDYPMLFWLKNLLKNGSVMFDFGGNVGTHFYGYENYLTYPQAFKWIVCELPALVDAGKELAQQEGRSQLLFTTDFNDASGAEVFLASGSVQYVPSLAAKLAKLPTQPQHLLLGRLPLCEGNSFVTLQNGGMVFYPVHVFNRQEFIDSIQAIGYDLIDSWKDRSEPCAVPFHPEFKSLSFGGLYFKAVPQ